MNIKKSLTYFSILTLTILPLVFLFQKFNVNAETVTTSVTVGNSAPTFTATPYEDPESSSSAPTNVGSDVTFKATGTDANSEDYYLIVCSSNSVTANNGSAPTCDATTWCTSSATTSGSEASCSRTSLNGDNEYNDWYAFVCDGNSSSADCSTSSQGSGATGSPFTVNHAPTFTNVSESGIGQPNSTTEWTTTSSDTDSDTVKLLVCKTEGISAGACTGDVWCSSSFVASNPSCTYDIPSVAPDVTNNAYAYIIDEHNFASTDAAQGTNESFDIVNVDPVVSAVTINGGSDINLTENSTKNITLTATVTDNNSCYGGEIASVKAYVYGSFTGYSGCDGIEDADDNDCYPEITCTVDGGTCTGDTDASANYTCTVDLEYFATPTDDNTNYPAHDWKDTIKAIDDDAATDSTEVSIGVEVNSLTAFSITSSINYGGLSAGQSNDPLDKTLITTPTGNVGLDQEHSGATNMCVDYPTCSGGTPIGVAYQKYALSTSTAYSSGVALSTSPTEVELNVPRPTSSSPTTGTTWWGILIPTGTDPGAYGGANTITAVKGEVINW